MQGSKFKGGDRSKGQTPRRLDSDGSGSVVSLQSSSSDDGKFPGKQISEGVNRPPVFQVDSSDEIGTQRFSMNRGGDDSARKNLDKIQQKLSTQPTHDTLDEIISTMKHHGGIKDSSATGMSFPLQSDSVVGGKAYTSAQSYSGSLGWNSSTPLQMSGHRKLGEKNARQLKDITTHFESEIDKIRDHLNGVGNNLSALQDALPVKILEAANHKLEARCNVLEQVCEQMKNKSARLEQSNHDLDSSCAQLRQINQNLEVRCLYLEQVSQANEKEKSHLQENCRGLEAKVVELAASNEKAIGACRQLEELNQKSENKHQEVEESKKLLESQYKSCVVDNQKLEAQIGQCQKTLEQYKKKFRDFEEAINTSKREKESLAMKLEFLNKGLTQVKQNYEELKSMCAAKDELITRLENEMRELSVFVEKTIKEKTEAEKHSKRDKELLQRMLIEYDVLVKDHQEAQESVKSMHDKLELSQSEMANLRETISKLVSRSNTKEDVAKEHSYIQENSHIEQSTGKNKLFTGRKTWEQSTPIKKRDIQKVEQSQLASSYTSPEIPRDVPSSELAASCHPYATSPIHSGSPAVADILKIPSCPTKKQDLSSNGLKSSTPSSQGKSGQTKPVTSKESPDTVMPAPYTVAGGMVVKKTDLLTRFDVVFEDTKSGEEMIRTHTGRTRRLYGEPAQTESSFLAAGDEAAGGFPESEFTGAHDARLLAVEDYERTISEPRKTKDKQTVTYDIAEKDLGTKNSQAGSKDHTEESENDMHLLERKFSMLTEERKRLESTLSRIPTQKMTKRSKEDKAYLESRLDEVVKEIGAVRMQLRRHHAL